MDTSTLGSSKSGHREEADGDLCHARTHNAVKFENELPIAVQSPTFPRLASNSADALNVWFRPTVIGHQTGEMGSEADANAGRRQALRMFVET